MRIAECFLSSPSASTFVIPGCLYFCHTQMLPLLSFPSASIGDMVLLSPQHFRHGVRFGDHLGGALDNLGSFNSEQAFPSDLVDFTVTFRIADTVSAISFFTPSGVPFREDRPAILCPSTRQQEGVDDAIPCILEPQGNVKAFRACPRPDRGATPNTPGMPIFTHNITPHQKRRTVDVCLDCAQKQHLTG
jgi:hypothetical protein